MKRIGYIYEKVYALGNIKKAIRKASLGKRNRKDVKKILDNIDYYAKELQAILKNESFESSPSVVKTIKDGVSRKEREIHIPKFYPDQCVHWALMFQLEPIMLKGMYFHSCGSIPGKGGTHAQKYVKRWMQRDKKNTKYYLKMDISKFYPSVQGNVMKQAYIRKIKDKKLLVLIFKIIDSMKGLPIGYYTSQWFGNFLLTVVDNFIKLKCKVKYYVRYVDDMVCFGRNKKELHKVRKAIEEYLSTLKLKLKGNWQVVKTKCRALDFIGVRFFYDKIILRKKTALRIRRRIKKIYRKAELNFKDAAAIISYMGWIKRTNSYNFYCKYMKPYINLKECKGVIRDESRKRQNTACYV